MGETDSAGIITGFVLGEVFGLVFGFVLGFVLGFVGVPLFPLSGFVVMGGFAEKPGAPNTKISETRIIAARTATEA